MKDAQVKVGEGPLKNADVAKLTEAAMVALKRGKGDPTGFNRVLENAGLNATERAIALGEASIPKAEPMRPPAVKEGERLDLALTEAQKPAGYDYETHGPLQSLPEALLNSKFNLRNLLFPSTRLTETTMTRLGSDPMIVDSQTNLFICQAERCLVAERGGSRLIPESAFKLGPTEKPIGEHSPRTVAEIYRELGGWNTSQEARAGLYQEGFSGYSHRECSDASGGTAPRFIRVIGQLWTGPKKPPKS